MNRMHLRNDVTEQNGFATTAKALLLVAMMAGGGLLAVGKMSANVPDLTPGTLEPAMPAAPILLADPDAELRPWLREAQLPTF
ncbi:MAG: hypothetical protein ACKVQU_20975 [Burkholderiales bacterium]